VRRASVLLLVLTSPAAACTSGGTSGGAPPADGGDAAAVVDGSLVDAPSPGDAEASVDAAVPVDAGADASDGSAALAANLQADEALEATLLSFWSQSQGYLVANPGSTTETGYWNFAQAWDTVLDGVQRHGGARFTGTLVTFYDAQDAIGWSRDYYDDENWMSLALIRAYDLTSDATYLAQAESLYADIMTAWDTTCCGTTPGGLWWDKAHTQKATASNAGPVITGARLYERTNDASYLAFAQQAYAYWAANMVDPTTYQVTDNITSAGVKQAWKFTYDQGLMLGAAVELAHATGSTSTLALAHGVAGFLLSSETEASDAGVVLTDGTDTSCTGDCAQFKGIAARYLALLYQADTSHSEYLASLASDSDAIWTIARDPASGLFGVDWAAPFVAPAQEPAATSAAMTLAALASLEGPPAADPPGVYEAEEGTLHDLGLEAKYAGFSGWGYVDDWNADGQWVDFAVHVPSAGAYDLAFRYAAGAGDASRLVYVNGANAVDNQSFAGTSAWSAYATEVVTTPLPAGASTVSLIYNSSLGSTSYLNLDVLTVTAH
jgi:predicted alpha-1,6-mannanase (GH76 family)